MGRTLTYWDVRGLGQPIRFLLAYLEVEYEDKRYGLAEPPHSRDEWLAVKPNLDLDFPNLPYWIDGDLKMTESRAIVRHIARVHDRTGTLLPNDPKIAYKTDMMENIVFDAMMGVAMFAYEYDPLKEDEKYKALHEKLAAISKYLGSNKWITGDVITFVDFWLYETLIWYIRFDEKFLDPYANFAEFIKRFEDLPSTKKYMNDPKYIQGPCINPLAARKI
ncbi:glutathione S-transferase Mu 1-like [Bradysia coprophila]|uniref:glutathione S-transferase Mu 1-like n=1 Tax=Bradysia coprophila TaxID=38358 RepID=UPI00187D9FCD|nr:glutathione S-transferase Mu 1-like [Bradysia coprophila]